ncbi:MAG: hypothetical protein J4F46_03965, partial [Dehalococcoidia bacterium]|nr:hypothetical protein [Dehalococcoidia bacterium]
MKRHGLVLCSYIKKRTPKEGQGPHDTAITSGYNSSRVQTLAEDPGPYPNATAKMIRELTVRVIFLEDVPNQAN